VSEFPRLEHKTCMTDPKNVPGSEIFQGHACAALR
jgi:hypothetical protein